LEQRSIRESGIAGEQLNKRIFLKKVFGVLLQTISFVRLVPFDRILSKDKVEVVDEEVEHVNGFAVSESKLFGSFSVNGGGQVALFGKQKPKEVGQGLLKIFEGKFCQRAGESRGTGRFGGLESEWRLEFLPVMSRPFDDVAYVDLSCCQTQQDESEQSGEGMGDALFGARIGNGLDGSGEGEERTAEYNRPPCR